MHARNIHRHRYVFKSLTKAHPPLAPFVIDSKAGEKSIDFSNATAVLELNRALLAQHYGIKNWKLPEHYLMPPIPSRAEYLHHIADILGKGNFKGLDIGCGASAIYCLLGHTIYNYSMVGADVDDQSVVYARKNTSFYDDIEIRQQLDHGSIFKNIIKKGERYDFTICNPPFYSSEEEALKENRKKSRQLGTASTRNFSGSSHELWCNGGEALFIKRMIKESVAFKGQVGWFTCLLSQKQNLDKPLKQLKKLDAGVKIVEMNVGNKKSRFVAWRFH